MADKDFEPLPSDREPDEKHIEKLIRLGGRRDEIDPACRERVRRHVHQVWLERNGPVARPAAFFGKPGPALAASIVVGCLAVIFALGYYLYPPAPEFVARVQNVNGHLVYQGNELKPESPVYPGGELETGLQDRVSLELADGSILKLDRLTRIHFSGQGEIQLATGAVYFDSRQRGDIRIHTPRGVASDIGTQFETRFEQDTLSIRVRDGRVRVEQPGNAMLVDAGRALEVADSTAVFSDIPERDEHWIWADSIDEQFSFDGHSMAEVLTWLARRENWQLRYKTDADQERAREEILHGELSMENTQELLRQLILISDMRYQLDDGVFWVSYP